MCGIAGGVWTSHGAPLQRAVLERMAAVLQHRGPDDEGFYRRDFATDGSAGGVALGFRRLAIIDVEGGRQPMANEDGSVHIVFNGEIYNYRELRNQLKARGHRFATASDTEVIVHLYEDYGDGCLEHLRGMFALALWDERRRRMLLARDRLGQKPLVYRLEPGRLLFASEAKAILQVPEVPREVDPVALDEYLTYQYVPHPRTIYRGIAKLPPAHYGVYEDGRLTLAPYWQPDFNHERPLPTAEYREQLRAALAEAVRLRLRSDVPLGAFLSGGIDSTIIVGLMQEQLHRPVKTFSIGFPVAAFDETRYARLAAEHLGTEHHEFHVTPDSLAVLPELVWHYDEPFADSSAIPTYYVSQYTRQHVTVALTGDGGDELFAGYPRYRAVKLAAHFDRLPRAARRVLASKWWQMLPASVEQKSRRRRLKKLLSALNEPPEQRYLNWIAIFDDARRSALYAEGFRHALHEARRSQHGPDRPFGRRACPALLATPTPPPSGAAASRSAESCQAGRFLFDAYARFRGRDFLTATTLVDLHTYLPCDLLTKLDIASMAHSLEARSPFLDHHVVELAAAMPFTLKMRGLKGKRILLSAFADLLPPAIRKRPKMGFGAPLDHWFRNELRELVQDVLLDATSLGRGYFRPQAVRAIVDEHLARRWDHSYRLWSLLFLELWHRAFVDPAAAPTRAGGAKVISGF